MARTKDEIDRTLALLHKRFGENSATRVGDERRTAAEIKEVIPIGIEVIDRYLLGIGGLPVGRIFEVFAAEGSGKTAFGLAVAAGVQRCGGTPYILDSEYSFDRSRAAVYGCRVNDLAVLEPEHIEMAIEQCKVVLSNHDSKHGPVAIIWDSLSNTRPKDTLALEAGEAHVAGQARFMSMHLSTLLQLCQQHRGILLVLNQVRDAIGVMFGDKSTTPGGKTLKFLASWRMQFFGGKAIKDPKTDAHKGKVVTLVVTKSRLTEPFRKALVKLDYARGWDSDWSTLEHAKTHGAAPGNAKGAKALSSARGRLGWGNGTPSPSTPPEEAVTAQDEEE